ncbi:MAG TPA: protein kinase [Thermoanaerobaculia bacterium]|nr:protein kinase [Thermoanaerobaculia bacterium]
MTLPAGTRLGPYEILTRIGAGGMGEVYRARDTRLGREVAIKVLPAEFSEDPERLKRFEQEARAASALNHPNIISVHDVGREGATSYIAMELVEGQSLRELLATGVPPLPKALGIAAQVADGLAKAHSAGIVHRDLKPENVMVSKDGFAKILDFGLAKSTRPGSDNAPQSDIPTATAATEPGIALGTIGYMSPEQVRGLPVDSRSDIFSFGAILYEVLTGRRAFRGASPADTLSAILKEEPPQLSRGGAEVPPALERVVRRCLEKNREERFESARDLAFALREAGNLSMPSQEPRAPARRRSRRLPVWSLALLGAAALLAVLFAGDVGGLRRRLWRGATAARIDSIAVLPLANLSGDPQQEYFADGMTEELISDLAKISALRVTSRTSVMRYKSSSKSLPEIAKDLGVEAVVEGSVTRAGSQVKITAQLIDAASDRHLWADSFQRELKDVLALQGEVARAIAREIGVRLTPQERSRLADQKTVNPEAYEAYLKGQYHLFRRTATDALKSLEYFREAVQKQPDYALAYAAIAGAYETAAGSAQGALPPKEAFPKAKAAALRAAELDPTLGEPYASLAWSSFVFDRDWTTAENQFQRALQLNTNYPIAHENYAMFLTRMGRFEEATREITRAQELDPVSLGVNTMMGIALSLARRDDEAIGWFRRVLDMDPNFVRAHFGLGLALVHKKRYDEAIAELRKAVELSGDGAGQLAALGYAYAAASRRAEALQIVEKLKERSREQYVPPAMVAGVLSSLGEKDQALAWLEKALDERDPWLTSLKVEPMYDALRSDPRFVDLLHRVGLN